MHGHVKRRAGNQVFVVHVAAMHAGRAAADPARVRRKAHDPEERPVDRHHHPARDLSGLSGAIDRDDPVPEGGKFVGQGAGVRPLPIVAPIEGELDVEDADLQHVAGHGAFDFDRAGQDMRAGAAVLHFAIDFSLMVRHCGRGHHTGSINDRGNDRGGAFERDDVAGFDAQDRL